MVSIARGRRGFTLIELMVVMTLIVLLASVGMSLYTNGVTRAKEAVLREDLFRMRDAFDQYYADRSRYPATLDALVEDGYLRAIPQDPFTQSADTWQVEMAPPNLADPAAQAGIFNIRSGSDQTALDGTAYAEW